MPRKPAPPKSPAKKAVSKSTARYIWDWSENITEAVDTSDRFDSLKEIQQLVTGPDTASADGDEFHVWKFEKVGSYKIKKSVTIEEVK